VPEQQPALVPGHQGGHGHGGLQRRHGDLPVTSACPPTETISALRECSLPEGASSAQR
jgi:hypothetical protein